MKTLLALLLLIPNLVFSKEINLKCKGLYQDSYKAGEITKVDRKDGVVFLKIDDNKFYFDGEEFGRTIHETTDDYYYIFDKKDSYWKKYLFDILEGQDGGNNGQMRINRKTGVLESWSITSKKLKYGSKKFFQCELVKNKF